MMKAVLSISVGIICEDWPGVCNTGKKQSPIDIRDVSTSHRGSVSALEYPLWDYPTVTTVQNDGHTVLVQIPGKIKPMLSGGGLKGTYSFENFHIHWPSEHTIEEERFHLEVHFVFYSSKFQNFTTAITDKNGVAVIGVLYDISKNQGSAVFNELANATRKVSEEVDSKTTTGAIVFEDMLPNFPDSFYHYRGSLTTPGCNEVVSWFILKDIGKISNDQYEKLTTIRGPDGLVIDFTDRNIQPLNGRPVYLKLS